MLLYVRLIAWLIITASTLAAHVGATAISGTSPQKFRISVAGGFSAYDMSTINKHYIDDFANEFDIFNEHITDGQHVLAEFEYFAAPKWSFGLGLSYLFGRIENETNTASYSLSTSMLIPEARATYYLTKSPIEVYVGGGLGYGFGRTKIAASYDEDFDPSAEGGDSENYEMHAQGIGFQLSGGSSIRISRAMLLGIEVGYRHYNTDELTDSEGETWYVSYLYSDNPPGMKLELSGLFLSGVLSFDL